MPSLPRPQPIPRYMTQDEVGAFFRAINVPRNHALFALIYQYGLRVQETSLLTRQDVDLDRSRILIKRVKGGVWSERPLFASTRELIATYLDESANARTEALFPGRNGPLKKRQIQSLFGQYRDRAQLSRRYTCHSLRHSIATHLLDAGVPLEFVQDHLGHRSIRSTNIYAKVTDRTRVELFRKLDASPWIVDPLARKEQT